jgi:hypothetical protein
LGGAGTNSRRHLLVKQQGGRRERKGKRKESEGGEKEQPEEKLTFKLDIDTLGGSYYMGKDFQIGATHLIVSGPCRSEKYLAALSCGIWYAEGSKGGGERRKEEKRRREKK